MRVPFPLRSAVLLLCALGLSACAQSDRHELASKVIAAPQAVARIRLTRDGVSLLLSISPDGRSLLYRDMGRSVGPDGTVWIMSADGRRRAQLVPSQVYDAAFLPDGRHVFYEPNNSSVRTLPLVASDLHGRTEHTFYLPGASLVQRAQGELMEIEPALSLAVLPDGHVTVYRDHRLLDLDPLRGRVTPFGPRLTLESDAVTYSVKAAISPNRKFLAAVSGQPGQPLVLWDLDTGQVIHKTSVLGGVQGLAWSPDSHEVAYVGGWFNEMIRAMDVRTGRAWTLTRLDMSVASSLEWSPNGAFISFAVEPLGSGETPNSRILLVSRDGRHRWWLDGKQTGPQPGETDIVWSSRATLLGYTRDYGNIYSQPDRNDIYLVKLG